MDTLTYCECGHPTRDHSAAPLLDSRAGCVRVLGLGRCYCEKIDGKNN